MKWSFLEYCLWNFSVQRNYQVAKMQIPILEVWNSAFQQASGWFTAVEPQRSKDLGAKALAAVLFDSCVLDSTASVLRQ